MSTQIARVGTIVDAKKMLKLGESEFAKLITDEAKREKFMRVAVNSFSRMPAQFAKCSQQSVMRCLLDIAAIGLLPDTVMQHCHLIPYGDNCQLIMGYRGLLELARRSGELVDLQAAPVWPGERFDVIQGTEPAITHVPDAWATRGPEERPLGVYAVARLTTGGVQFATMSTEEIESIRARSKAGRNGPWVTDWTQMALKTVVRRLCKTLPMSEEFRTAESLDYDQLENPIGKKPVIDLKPSDDENPFVLAAAAVSEEDTPEVVQILERCGSIDELEATISGFRESDSIMPEDLQLAESAYKARQAMLLDEAGAPA